VQEIIMQKSVNLSIEIYLNIFFGFEPKYLCQQYLGGHFHLFPNDMQKHIGYNIFKNKFQNKIKNHI